MIPPQPAPRLDDGTCDYQARRRLRRIKLLAAATLAALTTGCVTSERFRFESILIAEDVEGAYLTAVGDVNFDGRIDIILLSVRSSDVHWYENPDWTRHTLVSGVMPAAVGAAVDTSAEGPARIVVLTGFHRDDYEKNAGELVYLEGSSILSDAYVFAREPAAHRAQFGDIDGDGERELVVAPLSGANGGPPIDSSAPTPLVYFDPPDPARHVISDNLIGTVHGLTLVRWDNDERDDILTAGLGGVFLHWLAAGESGEFAWRSEKITSGRIADENGRAGAGDIRVGRLKSGERFLATIESVHGGDVAIYQTDKDGVWRRRLIGDGYELAHGFTLADFDGDGGDEIIVSDSRGEGGVFLYAFEKGGDGREWRRRRIDDKMAAGACESADFNGDGRLDIVCAGMQTRNLKLYFGRP